MDPIILAVIKKKFKFKDIKEVLQLAFPAMIENILQVLLGIVDTFFISKLGTEAIVGVGATNILMNLYIAFFTAVGVGTTAVVARNIGTKNIKKASHATQQSILMAVGIGFLTGFITLVFARQILEILGLEERVIEYTLPYFLVVAVPSAFLALMLVLSSALRGAGDTRTPMKVTLIVNVINVILDYVLIFGIVDFEGLGILGAGIATTASRLIGVLLILIFLNRKSSLLNISIKFPWTFDKILIKKISLIGYPAALERLVMRVGQLVYSAMIIKIGTDAYAAHNIAGSIESLSYMPGYGFAIAASTLVGQNLGAKRPDRSEYLGLLSNWLGTIFMVCVGIIFFIFARPLGLLFTRDEVVLKQVILVLRIIALVQPFLCITLVITAALQGAGDTRFPMYSTFIGIWGIRVIGVYILGFVFNMGLVGVWIAVASDLILRGVFLMFRYKRGKWKEIDIDINAKN